MNTCHVVGYNLTIFSYNFLLSAQQCCHFSKIKIGTGTRLDRNLDKDKAIAQFRLTQC